jgi:methanogenic corrinoid protein MtbC1
MGRERVLALTRASLRDAQSPVACVNEWLGQGRSLQDIYLHAIVPAARLLGLWWLSDRLDFSGVTVASSRLHRLLYDFSPLFLADAKPQKQRSVLLMPEPGSQHTMGIFMLSEFFRREGWFVELLSVGSVEQALHHVQAHWFDVAAISVSSTRQLNEVKVLIGNLRKTSPNNRLAVMLGGPLALMQPQRLQGLGHDGQAADALEALEWAEQAVWQP